LWTLLTTEDTDITEKPFSPQENSPDYSLLLKPVPEEEGRRLSVRVSFTIRKISSRTEMSREW
jgi:hypothetical protein